jgi:hypothetical protein
LREGADRFDWLGQPITRDLMDAQELEITRHVASARKLLQAHQAGFAMHDEPADVAAARQARAARQVRQALSLAAGLALLGGPDHRNTAEVLMKLIGATSPADPFEVQRQEAVK